MSQQTPNLSLPVMMPAQAQKHVTHNEALERLDAIVQLVLESVTISQAPSDPVEGQSWGVGAAASGVWSGQAGQIASWRGGGWFFVSAQEGWLAWCKDDATLKVRMGGGWQTLAGVAV